MVRFGLLIVVGMATCGCASSGKIVAQDGYRGIAPTTPGGEAGRPVVASFGSTSNEIGFASSHAPVNP